MTVWRLRRGFARARRAAALRDSAIDGSITMDGEGLVLIRLGRSDRETLSIMDKQLGHMSRLVDDVLDIARVVRGQLKLERRPMSLARVLESSIESIRPLPDGRCLSTDIRDPEALHAHIDEMRVEQVFNNVLRNAVKFSPPDSAIDVEAFAQDGHAVVRVRDRGVGIDPEFLPHLFALFSQADRSLDRSPGGLGLGLALSRRIVEQHGGTIRADSDGPGQGSVFTIALPLAAARVAIEEFPETPQPVDGAVRRVLVVDDNVDAATGVARLAQAVGAHHVRLAHDGPSALDEAADFGPDLVLLDIGLPGMDGLEVARTLRARAGAGSMLIVALTGYGGEEDRLRTAAAGCDQHRVKPLKLEQLVQLLSTRREPC